jgi:hypothetical protein
MELINYNHGKFFSPAQSYMGYVFIGAGIFAATYSSVALLLIVPGIFIAFTSTGTIIDTTNKRVRPYTSFFGIYRSGKWIDANQFTHFSITRATKKYTSYSRGSVRFDMNIPEIRLMLLNHNGSKKVMINRFNNFEDAQKSMEELKGILLPENDKVNKDIQ